MLIVDDDDVDVGAIVRALRGTGIEHPFVVAHDGVEALSILRSASQGIEAAWPWIVLLDLNMPRMNGFEFLREIRSDPKLKSLVVFVLSTSDDERDKQQAYEFNVAGYLVKRSGKETMNQLIEMLRTYLRNVSFPQYAPTE